MFQFPSRISLSVYIGYFLEFQRAFHSHRILCSPSEKKSVFLVTKKLRPLLNLALQFKRMTDLVWKPVQFVYYLRLMFDGEFVIAT